MKHKNREYLSQYLNVFDQKTNEQVGYLADISKKGMMFVTHFPSKENKILNIYILLDYEKVGILNGLIKVQIQTCWIRPNINREIYCIGCKILNIDQEAEKMLEEAANYLGFELGSDVEIRRVCHDKDLDSTTMD